MKLLELRIKNVPPFKQATLDLGYEGITLIRGINKDAGPGATNAAGKSALIGAIPELVLDESPSGKEEKVKKAKGTKAKKIEIGIKLQKGEHVYDVTKTMGKGKSYDILKNGKTLNTRTVAYNQQRIAGLFNLPEEQFYSRFYIDSTLPHPLIVGKASAKQEFIVQLFNLNDVDTIRKLLNAELTAVQKKGIELRTISTSIADLREDLLPKTERETMGTKLEAMRADQTKLTHQLQTSQAISELVSFQRQHKPLIKELASLTTLDDLPATFKTVKGKIAKLKEQREAASDWSTYDRLVRLYEKSRKPVADALEAEGVGEEDVRASVKRAHNVDAEIRQLQRSRVEPGPKPKKVEEPTHARDKCLGRIGALKHEIDSIRVLKTGVCPTCGQKVDARPLSEVQAELQKWSRRLAAHDEWTSYTKQKSEWTSASRGEAAYTENLAILQRKQRKLKPLVRIAELLEDVPPKPKRPESERPEGFDERKLERLQEQMSILQQGRDLLETLKACSHLTDKQVQQAEQASAYLSELNSINAEVSALTSKLAQQREILRRLRGLKDRASVLEEECKDEKILKALVGAHSTSGLKKFMIERYSKLLEEQINKYRKIFFSEDYQFEFRYDSKLSLLVHRKYGKRVVASDVKKLSGAEKRLFTLLLVVATSTMLPVKQRTNVLILDEPEANMGASFVEQLIKSLPLLNKLVPHIIFVTPRTELEIPNSRVLTVVKHHGVAELVPEKKAVHRKET